VKRTEGMTVRFTKEEMNIVQRAANKLDCKRAQIVRLALRDYFGERWPRLEQS